MSVETPSIRRQLFTTPLSRSHTTSDRPPAAEIAFMLAALILIINPSVLDVLSGDLASRYVQRYGVHAYVSGGTTSFGSTATWMTIFLISGLLFLRHTMNKRVLAAAFPVIVFCAYQLATTLWSDYPNTTFMRAVSLTGKSVFAIYFVHRVGLNLGLALLAWALTLVLTAGWLLAVFEPEVAWQNYRGGVAMRGLFTHKTGFGVVGAVLFLTAIGLASTPNKAFLHIVGLIFAAVLAAVSLYFAKSVSANFLVGIGLAVFVTARFAERAPTKRSRRRRLFALLIVVGLALVLPIAQFAVVAEVTGRDVSLSGRMEIWRAIILSDSVWTVFGHGYYAFWRLDPGGDLFEIVARQGFLATSPHNAFLLAWLDGGIIGLAIFVWLLAYALLRAARRTIARDFEYTAICLALLCVTVVAGFVESNLFKGQQVGWLLLVFVTVGTAPAPRPTLFLRRAE